MFPAVRAPCGDEGVEGDHVHTLSHFLLERGSWGSRPSSLPGLPNRWTFVAKRDFWRQKSTPGEVAHCGMSHEGCVGVRVASSVVSARFCRVAWDWGVSGEWAGWSEREQCAQGERGCGSGFSMPLEGEAADRISSRRLGSLGAYCLRAQGSLVGRERCCQRLYISIRCAGKEPLTGILGKS